jgi:hypothetical protein
MLKINLFDDPEPDEPAEPGTEIDRPAAAPAMPRFSPANMVAQAEMRFNAIENEVKKELKPKSYIGNIYAKDFAFDHWQNEQYRGFNNSLVRKNLQPALENILKQLLGTTETPDTAHLKAKRLANGWLRNNKKDQFEVERILTDFNLDERCIEAEAWRLSSTDAAMLQRMQTLTMNSRDKAYSNFIAHRDYLATQPEQTEPKNFEAEEVPTDKSLLS